jgi:carboxypeptidase PM20D1
VAPYLSIVVTDSRHYAGIAGDVYRFGPVILESEDLQRPHGTNERISIEGFGDMIRFFARLIDSIE